MLQPQRMTSFKKNCRLPWSGGKRCEISIAVSVAMPPVHTARGPTGRAVRNARTSYDLRRLNADDRVFV